MSRILICLALLTVSAGSCRPAAKTVGTANDPGINLIIDGKLWASFFQQRSAEYRALCQQAYNIASLRVNELAVRQSLRPMAIVTDIDETFLDNSPYAVRQALAGRDYEQSSWAEWTARGMADTLQGALPFFRLAVSRGIAVFYITNREESERQGTLANLKKFDFPFADDEHLVMRTSTSSKESRRVALSEKYDIVMLLGDNLADFSSIFDKKNETDRASAVNAAAAEFGHRFILLPNPVYGGWEESFYQFNMKRTSAEKDSLIRHSLKGY
ncbi:MAG: 5'-nucleotidase, lipoprotein e(P4) family [Chitinophagaceae bacterium]|nr:MAG: 5'-nucleotidase, lipoprotein e(P4) family [Chitinophagaceae bacterium]